MALDELEKEQLLKASFEAVHGVAKVRGIDFFKLSDEMRALLIDCFVAGASVALKAVIDSDNKKQ